MTTTTVPSADQPATSTSSQTAAVPPSPRQRQVSTGSALSEARDPTSLSRRHSEQRMLPPPAPLTQPPYAQPPSPGGSIRSQSSVSGSELNGPGPTRLPRQLSPAEIHAELEKEQEAAVNRLTRQLSILRAQQVASPTSHPISDDLANTYPSTYLSPRSRRTSSNASTALTNAATIGSNPPTAGGTSLSRQSSIQSLSASRDPTSATSPPPHAIPIASSRPGPTPMSRQSSVRSISGSRNSGRNSPALGDHESPYPYFGSQYYYTSPHLHPSSDRGGAAAGGPPPGSSGSWKEGVGMQYLYNHHHQRREQDAGSETGGSERGLGVHLGQTGGHPRYEEVLAARGELETVKKENEKLKEKIRELERALSGVGSPASSTGATVATSASAAGGGGEKKETGT